MLYFTHPENKRLLYPCTSVEAPWQFLEGETTKPGGRNSVNELLGNNLEARSNANQSYHSANDTRTKYT